MLIAKYKTPRQANIIIKKNNAPKTAIDVHCIILVTINNPILTSPKIN